jgi:hypothetical protein
MGEKGRKPELSNMGPVSPTLVDFAGKTRSSSESLHDSVQSTSSMFGVASIAEKNKEAN